MCENKTNSLVLIRVQWIDYNESHQEKWAEKERKEMLAHNFNNETNEEFS